MFLVFGLPAVAFFADGCYTSMACLRGVEFVLVFRTYAIYLGFLFSSPRNWLEAWSVHIILAKRLGVSLVRKLPHPHRPASLGTPASCPLSGNVPVSITSECLHRIGVECTDLVSCECASQVSA